MEKIDKQIRPPILQIGQKKGKQISSIVRSLRRHNMMPEDLFHLASLSRSELQGGKFYKGQKHVVLPKVLNVPHVPQ